MAAALLIVEDNDEDYEAIVRAFARLGGTVDVRRASDADEALEALHDAGRPPKDEPLPAVVLLDLNLPGSDGREVLAEVKATERLRKLPVVVFSASANPKVIAECYKQGASGYMVKPMDFDRLERLLRSLKEYWLDSVELPPEHVD
jgi:CheY-like chemotaxis protein